MYVARRGPDRTKIMDNPLDQVSTLLDQITKALQAVGIEVPAFSSQVVMLVLIVTLLYVLRKTWWPLAKAALQGLMGAAVLFITGLLIVASWVGQWSNPPPSTVQGIILGGDRARVSIKLMDLHGNSMGQPPVVDPQNGNFLAFYEFSLGRYPRSLSVIGPDCEKHVSVTLSQLREGHIFQVRYDCSGDDASES